MSDVRIECHVLHAGFAPERRPILQRLVETLGPDLHVHVDHEGKGSLGPWLKILESLDTSATHMCFLPDDCELVPHFTAVLTEAVRSRPNDIICCQTNHDQAPKVPGAWYTTPDGFTAFGGTMPIRMWKEHLRWRQTELRPEVIVQGDEGVNLWAMATGRLIYKTVPSLVEHDLTVTSLDGNQHQTDNRTVWRRGTVFDPEAQLLGRNWDTPAVHLGRSYNEMHWKLISKLRMPRVRLAYELDRDRSRAP